MQLRRRQRFTMAGVAVVATVLSLAACSSSSSSTTTSTSTATSSSTATASSTAAALSGTINGSGSTFQTVYQEAAIAAFRSVQPGMTVNYGSGGSGKGRSDLAAGVTNFGGSDTAPIPSAELPNFKGKTVLYFPVFLGPITISYNLSGVTNLKLDATVIAEIFNAKITTWNNPAITALNPGVTLPSTPITIAVRSDSSGTTQNFSLYLEKAAGSAWPLGSSSTIKWPTTARAGNGNGGVAAIVKSTAGAIGYVDYADAKASGLTFASVKNSSGDYIAPSPSSASAAGNGITITSNLTFHAVDSPNASAYPITYQSWVLVYEVQPNANDAAMLKAYIGYLISPTGGQALLDNLGYAPLPSSLDQMAQAQLSKIGM
jgi:phosphate transport system substrate-binding protein